MKPMVVWTWGLVLLLFRLRSSQVGAALLTYSRDAWVVVAGARRQRRQRRLRVQHGLRSLDGVRPTPPRQARLGQHQARGHVVRRHQHCVAQQPRRVLRVACVIRRPSGGSQAGMCPGVVLSARRAVSSLTGLTALQLPECLNRDDGGAERSEPK